ncbi:MAG TPA: hypothetical protein VF698_14115, partial [Thermoanaerobaculia bacterium]
MRIAGSGGGTWLASICGIGGDSGSPISMCVTLRAAAIRSTSSSGKVIVLIGPRRMMSRASVSLVSSIGLPFVVWTKTFTKIFSLPTAARRTLRFACFAAAAGAADCRHIAAVRNVRASFSAGAACLSIRNFGCSFRFGVATEILLAIRETRVRFSQEGSHRVV